MEPLPEEIAKELEINPDGVKEILYSNSVVHSLDTPISGDEAATHADFIEDNQAVGQDTLVDNYKKINILIKCLEVLDQREKDVLTMRFGLKNSDVHTLDEIGSKYDLTRERIRQIEQSAINKIRASEMGKQLLV